MNLAQRSLLTALAAGGIGLAPQSSPAQDTNYGQVAMYVANMLQSHHYSRQDFDDTVSKRLLDNYLQFLDFNRSYFTKVEVDAFRAKYETKLDDLILVGDTGAAHDIYNLYQQRVKERHQKIKGLLENEKFTFDSDREVILSRKEAEWPKDAAAGDALWRDIIEGELLQERLRIRAVEAAKKEKAEKKKAKGEKVDAKPKKKSPEDELTPEQRVAKRYDRFVKSLDDNDEEEVNNFFLSALATAYDPHSEYFSESEMENFRISMVNKLIGIGALLSTKDGAAEIQGLVLNGPAQRAGTLQVNDRIVGVGQGEDGEMVDILYMKLQKIVELIRGEKDSIVRLKISPADAEDPSITEEISIVRDTVELKDKLANAELFKAKGDDGKVRNLGFINLGSFYADMDGGTVSTTEDVTKLLVRLQKEGVEGLVIDLRSNGGGSLDEAISLTGLFINRGPVVQQKNWQESIEIRNSRRLTPLYDKPLMVLVDKASASASEIFAAALQDYGRAVVVGDSSSFGKGTVQTILDVKQRMPFFSKKDRAGALKVTIQKFYRISGGSTQLKGVVPDVTLPSRLDGMDVGEASLNYPLEYDAIKKPKYNQFAPLPLADIKTKVAERMAKNPEFQYIIEDSKRFKEQLDKNSVSLNEAERIAEVDKNKTQSKERKARRREAMAKMAKGQVGRFERFRLTLDNVAQEKLVPEAEFTKEDSTGMILAKNDDDEDEETLLPHDLDPTKLEAIRIMEDLIDLTAKASNTAKVGAAAEG